MLLMSHEMHQSSQQSCFELVDSHMGRDLYESEILGLQRLIKHFGPNEIENLINVYIRGLGDLGIGVNQLDQAIDLLYKNRVEEFGVHDLISRELLGEIHSGVFRAPVTK